MKLRTLWIGPLSGAAGFVCLWDRLWFETGRPLMEEAEVGWAAGLDRSSTGRRVSPNRAVAAVHQHPFNGPFRTDRGRRGFPEPQKPPTALRLNPGQEPGHSPARALSKPGQTLGQTHHFPPSPLHPEIRGGYPRQVPWQAAGLQLLPLLQLEEEAHGRADRDLPAGPGAPGWAFLGFERAF